MNPDVTPRREITSTIPRQSRSVRFTPESGRSHPSYVGHFKTASLLVVSRLYNQGGDDAEKSGAGGGSDSDSLNRTGPTRAMPTRMHAGNRERRN